MSRPEANQSQQGAFMPGALLKIALLLTLLSCTAGIQIRVAPSPRSRGRCLQQGACDLLVSSRQDLKRGTLRLRGGIGRTGALLSAAEEGDTDKVSNWVRV